MKNKNWQDSPLKSILCGAAALVLLLAVLGFGWFSNASKLTEHETATRQVPRFSAKAGFYDEGFYLKLSAASGSTVYYTLDGSDPRTSETAEVYTEAIPIYDNTKKPNKYSKLTEISLNGYAPPKYNVDKCITVRAAVKTRSGEFGEVVTNSYFVGKDKDFYSDMKVISMVTDADYLFNEDTGIYMIGSQYYEWKNSPDFVKYDGGDVQNKTNYNATGPESEIPVTVQVFEKGRAVYSTAVGTRITGHWSRAHAQKSLRLYARNEYGGGQMEYDFFEDLKDINGRPIRDFDKVTLRNSGNDFQELHFRDALIHDLAKGLECEVMAAEPCILFINGEYWGFYMIREKTDGDYFESHYGIPKEDIAVVKVAQVEEGTADDVEEFRELCNWAAAVDMTDEENYKKLCDSMDIQSLMDYIAVETYINNSDWANGGSNNWAAWRSKITDTKLPKADGKWRFILFDTDCSTASFGDDKTQYDYDLLNEMYVSWEDFNIPNVVRSLCRNDEFRQAFYENYIQVMKNCFEPNEVTEKIDYYVENYGEAIKDTLIRFDAAWAVEEYDYEVEKFKEYFCLRPQYAEKYLAEFCESNR